MQPVKIQVVDASGVLNEPEEMALCPVCDGPMFEYEEVVIGVMSGVKCLIHLCCIEG